MYESVASVMVSPGRGRFRTRATTSMLMDPTTVSSGGKRAEVFERSAEQVLAEVEEPRPERRAVRRRVHPDCGRQPLECADEHCELEVDLRDAMGCDTDPGAAEHGRPVHELGRSGLAVPRPTL